MADKTILEYARTCNGRIFGGGLAHLDAGGVPRDISVLGGSGEEDVLEPVEVGPEGQLVDERLPDIRRILQCQLV